MIEVASEYADFIAEATQLKVDIEAAEVRNGLSTLTSTLNLSPVVGKYWTGRKSQGGKSMSTVHKFFFGRPIYGVH